MYVRVKRQKTTVFLQVNPTDTVATLKSAIGDLIQQEQSTQQLYRGSTALTDTQTLAELGVHDDDELGLALKKEDGTWEALEIMRHEAPSDGVAE
ncbi:hypothetical protein ACKKBF_B18645 [Auxenochlorella protothecoides x Auxenochlorella symbiontica]